jgi:hypothetical protein
MKRTVDMWVFTLPWGVIGQGLLSEAFGSLTATGLLAVGSWSIRRVRRLRRNKRATASAASRASLSLQDRQLDA